VNGCDLGIAVLNAEVVHEGLAWKAVSPWLEKRTCFRTLSSRLASRKGEIVDLLLLKTPHANIQP
jgi:hypothetical protein